MATQGLVSVVDLKGNVLLKAVCGCNGFKAGELASLIKENKSKTVKEIFDLAKSVGFGCQDCLVVYGTCDEFFSSDGELPSEYSKFLQDPYFNPRWNRGTADYTEIVTLE
ncbi:MAG: (2Fe-2S)-binding protein [Candidatus Omnitrophica bacterium]|nr:(2Fe-2S)-binding protein [Candidatus Omnitrophota bacterium]